MDNPERIYLHGNPGSPEWSGNAVDDTDTEYVRADICIAQAQMAYRDGMRAAGKSIRKYIEGLTA